MVQFQRIGTINIAVRSAEDARARFEELGLPASTDEIIDLSDPPAQIRYFQLPIGESSFSLIEPSDDASPVARFLGKRGEGAFSINIVVDDLVGLMDEWRRQGIVWVLDEPMRFEPSGGREHGGFVNWVRPDQINGLLLEFTQPDDA